MLHGSRRLHSDHPCPRPDAASRGGSAIHSTTYPVHRAGLGVLLALDVAVERVFGAAAHEHRPWDNRPSAKARRRKHGMPAARQQRGHRRQQGPAAASALNRRGLAWHRPGRRQSVRRFGPARIRDARECGAKARRRPHLVPAGRSAGAPSMASSSGRPNSRKLTIAATGLPGRPMTGRPRTQPNMIGLPGFSCSLMPPRHPAAGQDGPLHMVRVAAGGAAGAEDDVTRDGARREPRQGCRIVGMQAAIEQPGWTGRREGPEHRPVRIVNTVRLRGARPDPAARRRSTARQRASAATPGPASCQRRRG